MQRAAESPDWSVASDAEGGSGERGGPARTHLSNWLHRSARLRSSWWTQNGRGRLSRPRLRKNRRDEERSCGRGTSSGRGLSGIVAGARCSAVPLGCRLLVETVEQLRDIGAILPAPMRADRRNQRSSRVVAQMAVPGVVDDEPRRRDDPRVRNPSTSSAFARTIPSVSPSSRPNVGRESGVSSRS